MSTFIIIVSLTLASTFSGGETTFGGGSGLEDTSVQSRTISVTPEEPIPPPAPRPISEAN